MVKENFVYSYLEFSSDPEEDIYFKFRLTNKGDVNLRVIQRFDRFINDSSYEYSPLIFEYGRIDGDESVTFMGEGS
jgi:hypothetical protein